MNENNFLVLNPKKVQLIFEHYLLTYTDVDKLFEYFQLMEGMWLLIYLYYEYREDQVRMRSDDIVINHYQLKIIEYRNTYLMNLMKEILQLKFVIVEY